jgi:hypothetical protein
MDLEPSDVGTRGHHFRQVRQPQPDAGASKASVAECDGHGSSYFVCRLPPTMRSQ